MTVYGVGCKWRSVSMVKRFRERGAVAVNCDPGKYPAYHEILSGMNLSDIVYLKTYSDKGGLKIHAVGWISHDEKASTYPWENAWGRRVRWIWPERKEPLSVNEIKYEPIIVGKIYDGWDQIRATAIYQDPSSKIIKVVMHLLSYQDISAYRVKNYISV